MRIDLMKVDLSKLDSAKRFHQNIYKQIRFRINLMKIDFSIKDSTKIEEINLTKMYSMKKKTRFNENKFDDIIFSENKV